MHAEPDPKQFKVRKLSRFWPWATLSRQWRWEREFGFGNN